MENLTIGKLAEKAKVNRETIRYYERRGLIPEPPRLESGYRQYPSDTVLRIQFIKRAKEMGFSLKEISELLLLKVDLNTTCDDVKKKTEKKIEEIEEKIKTLQKIKKALTKLTELCRGQGSKSECPILDALESEKIKPETPNQNQLNNS